MSLIGFDSWCLKNKSKILKNKTISIAILLFEKKGRKEEEKETQRYFSLFWGAGLFSLFSCFKIHFFLSFLFFFQFKLFQNVSMKK